MNPALQPATHAPKPGQPPWQRIASRPGTTVRKALLVCGILSALLYALMNVFVPMLYEGYSVASQTVSELSAIGAPTRMLWVVLGVLYTLLFAAFGWGVWKSAGPSRTLRIVGGVMVLSGILGLFWPPMHQRGTEFTLTDTLHIAWTMIWGLLTLLAMGFGAAALGRRFRIYSIATMVVLLACGFMTSVDAPKIQANLPTPWVGVWERINIAAFLVWLAALAVTLLRRQDSTMPDDRGCMTTH